MRYPQLSFALTPKIDVRPSYAPIAWDALPNFDFDPMNISNILSAAKNCGFMSIGLKIGDPFLVDHLLKIILSEFSTSTSWKNLDIFTYGTSSINEDTWNLLVQLQHRVRIFFQLDTLDKANYKKIYSQDHLEQVLRNLETARSHNIEIIIFSVVS